MPEPMSDERVAEIRAEYEAFGGPAEMAELLAEVDRMRAAEALVQEQVDVVRRIGEADAARAAYEAMDAERRGWESRRAVDNLAMAELRRERDEARAEVERLRDGVEHLTACLNEKDEEIRRLWKEFDQSLLGVRVTALESDLHGIVRYLEDGAVEDALRTAKSALDGEEGR